MNKQNSHTCPNCGHPLSVQTHIQKANGGTGRAPAHTLLGGFALGSAGNTINNGYKLHKKPVHKLEADHLALSAIAGGFSAIGILGGGALLCEVGIFCPEPVQIILGAVLGGGVVGLAVLRFIDNGRYEIREETTPQTVATSAPKAVASEPVIHRVEVKTTRQNGRVSFQWFDLPKGITPKLLRRVGTALQANEWRYSRPLLCNTHKVISQHKFHKLTALLKDKGMVTTDGNASYLNGAGRSFFRQFMPLLGV